MPVGRDETSGKLTGQLSGPSASEGPPPLLRKQSSLLKLAEMKKPPLKRQRGEIKVQLSQTRHRRQVKDGLHR